jgi:hypothetical protein
LWTLLRCHRPEDVNIFAGDCQDLLRMGKAFSTQTEKTREVAGCLLKEIISSFRIPVTIGSDNGPACVAEVVQLVAKGLGTTWKLHMPYCPPRVQGK